jgi:hypothetical protein
MMTETEVPKARLVLMEDSIATTTTTTIACINPRREAQFAASASSP